MSGSEKMLELRPATVSASLNGSFSSSSSSSSLSAAISASTFFKSTNLRLSILSFASDLARATQSFPVRPARDESSACDLIFEEGKPAVSKKTK